MHLGKIKTEGGVGPRFKVVEKKRKIPSRFLLDNAEEPVSAPDSRPKQGK